MKGFLKISAACVLVLLVFTPVLAQSMRDFYNVRTDMNEAEVEEAMGGPPDRVIWLGSTIKKEIGEYVKERKYMWVYYRMEAGTKKRIEIVFVNGLVDSKTWNFAK